MAKNRALWYGQICKKLIYANLSDLGLRTDREAVLSVRRFLKNRLTAALFFPLFFAVLQSRIY